MRRIRQAKHGPEWHIQQDLIVYLETRGWLVERMIGNAFQTGIPDLYVSHPKWGSRWIDVKNPGAYSFTKAQKRKWPVWERFGVGIWIVTSADQEGYDKLFAPPNWRSYVKKNWHIPTIEEIDTMMSEIAPE